MYTRRPLLQLRTVFQLCACHPHASNMTVAERFATFRYYCLMPVQPLLAFTVTKNILDCTAKNLYKIVQIRKLYKERGAVSK